MKDTKLNNNWTATEIIDDVQIISIDDSIEIKFMLDASAHEHIDNGETGSIEFSNVYAFARTKINRAQYLENRFRYQPAQLAWGGFKELSKSKWDKDFPADMKIINSKQGKKKFRHFILFLNDEVFECLAMEYNFTYHHNAAMLLDDVYPKAYFNYYLSMFKANFDSVSTASFNIYTDLYIQIQGRQEFESLKGELNLIMKNEHLLAYLKIANESNIAGFGIRQLEGMVKVIREFKLN